MTALPVAFFFHVDMPGFAALSLYLALGDEGGLLSLLAPLLAAIGLARVVLPMPASWWRAGSLRALH